MKAIKLPTPKYVEASTHEGLMNKIQENGRFAWVSRSRRNGSSGHYFGLSSSTYYARHRTVRLFNIHKVRAKKSPDHSKVVREAKWYGYVYDLNSAILDASFKHNIHQNPRNFDMVIHL